MIVSEAFKGDNISFQWVQHDHYNEALRTIFNGCRSYYIFRFENNPENETLEKLKKVQSYDHRLLQNFHDHMAAYWRKKFFQPNLTNEENAQNWLSWLQKEMHESKALQSIYLSVCFLALEDSETDHEKQMLESLQSKAKKYYPIKFSNYLSWVQTETILNIVFLGAALTFAVWLLQRSLQNLMEFAPIVFIFTAVFSAVGIYAYREKLQKLGSENANSWALKLITIIASSFGIAFLIVGLMSFEG